MRLVKSCPVLNWNHLKEITPFQARDPQGMEETRVFFQIRYLIFLEFQSKVHHEALLIAERFKIR